MPDLGDRTTLKNSFDTRINNNTSQDITPTDVRESLDDTVDTLGAEIDTISNDVAEVTDDLTNFIAQYQAQDTWTFSDTTADADPGAGNLRFNNGTIASVTQIYVDDVDASGANRSAYVNTWSGALVLQVQYQESGGTWVTAANPVVFAISSITDASGYTKLTVTHVSGTLPANGALLKLVEVGYNGVNAATQTAIDAKVNTVSGLAAFSAISVNTVATGAVSLGTVPVGKMFLPMAAHMHCTAAVSATVAPSSSIGTNAATYNNIGSASTNTGLLADDSTSQRQFNAGSIAVPAGTEIFINITVAATATSQQATVRLVGILIDSE